MKKYIIVFAALAMVLTIGACSKKEESVYIPGYGSYSSEEKILTTDKLTTGEVSGWQISLEYAAVVDGRLNVGVSSISTSCDTVNNIKNGSFFGEGGSEGKLTLNGKSYDTAAYSGWSNLPLAMYDEYVFEPEDTIASGDKCTVSVQIEDETVSFNFTLREADNRNPDMAKATNGIVTVYAEGEQVSNYYKVKLTAVADKGYELYRYGSAPFENDTSLYGPVINGGEVINQPPVLLDNDDGESHDSEAVLSMGFTRRLFLYKTGEGKKTLNIPHITLQSRENATITEQFKSLNDINGWTKTVGMKNCNLKFELELESEEPHLYCTVERKSNDYRAVGVDFVPLDCNMKYMNYQLDMLLAKGYTASFEDSGDESNRTDISECLSENFGESLKLELRVAGIKYTVPLAIEEKLE